MHTRTMCLHVTSMHAPHEGFTVLVEHEKHGLWRVSLILTCHSCMHAKSAECTFGSTHLQSTEPAWLTYLCCRLCQMARRSHAVLYTTLKRLPSTWRAPFLKPRWVCMVANTCTQTSMCPAPSIPAHNALHAAAMWMWLAMVAIHTVLHTHNTPAVRLVWAIPLAPGVVEPCVNGKHVWLCYMRDHVKADSGCGCIIFVSAFASCRQHTIIRFLP
jgi:hypothetical protein